MWLDSCRQLVVVRNCKLELHHRRKEVRFRSDCHKKNEVWMASSYLIQEGFLGSEQNEWVIFPPPDSTWWGLLPSFEFFLKSGTAHPVFKRTGLLGGAERPRVLSDGIAIRARSSSWVTIRLCWLQFIFNAFLFDGLPARVGNTLSKSRLAYWLYHFWIQNPKDKE